MHTFVKTGQRSCLLYSSNVMILLVSHFTYLKSELLHKKKRKCSRDKWYICPSRSTMKANKTSSHRRNLECITQV